MEPASNVAHRWSALENRERFFERIAKEWPPDSPQYRLIERAYDTAKEALRGIEREEGVRYFEHARGVALILLDHLGIYDPATLCLALLHDVVEENPDEWSVERVRLEFGDIIGDGEAMLTKPKEMWKLTDCGLAYHGSFWYAPRRVATVKLADRYHNLQTLRYCSLAKQLRKREETRKHYLPLARFWNILAREIEMLLEEPPELRLEGIP
jgi:guanosine-3',5'-bis(diphosphate) 3'-pyrophosphohydrolase